MKENKGIVINRMYAGSYLSTNLGHEVINMFQDDKGRHYLYLNAKGNFSKMHEGHISDMLLVRYAGINEGKSEVQVLGWARGLESIPGAGDAYQGYDVNGGIFVKQRNYISQNDISYGNADLIELFDGSDQQNVYITYYAREFYRPQKPIYIQYVNENALLYNTEDSAAIIYREDRVNINLSGYQFGKATLKQYIYPTAHKNGYFRFDKRKKNSDYQEYLKDSHCAGEEEFITALEETVNVKRSRDWDILLRLLDTHHEVDGQPLWIIDEKGSRTVAAEGLDSFEPNSKDVSLFDIMPKLQRDENCFSDALKFFINRDKEQWHKIFMRLCNDDNIGSILSIEREKDATVSNRQKDEEQTSDLDKSDNSSGGRIDLLIRTENAYIVIENKIKSDINRTKADSKGEDQLDRYRRYVEHCIAGRGDIKSYFFILAPDYNMPDKEERKGYKPLHYSTLVGKHKKDINNEAAAEMMKRYHETHKNENLWSAFFDAMKRHSYDYENESLYEDMKNIFFTRIQKCPKKDNNA